MKTFYYSDELNDDFASTKDIKTKALSPNYPWIRKSFLWRLFSGIVYFLIIFPLAKLITHVYCGLKIKNRHAIKKLQGRCFLYSNHTQHLDPLISAMVSGWGHRTYFLAGLDTFSIFGIKHLVAMLGAMPVAYDLDSMRQMVHAIKTRYREDSCLVIYPEAHIWPYYTGIRNFPDASFSYPVDLNAPVIAMVVTYRKRRGISRLFFKHPCVTVYCSEPMYADSSLGKKAAKKDLRDRVYAWMKETAVQHNECEFIHYEKKL